MSVCACVHMCGTCSVWLCVQWMCELACAGSPRVGEVCMPVSVCLCAWLLVCLSAMHVPVRAAASAYACATRGAVSELRGIWWSSANLCVHQNKAWSPLS